MAQWQSIQFRLIAAFLVVALFSLSGLSVMEFVSGPRTAQEEINRRLSTVVSFKSQIIREWSNTLKADLGAALTGKTDLQATRSFLEPDKRSSEAITRELRVRFLSLAAQSRSFDELMLLDPNGVVKLATLRAHEGRSFAGEDFFEAGKQAPSLSSPQFSLKEGRTLMFSAYPILNPDGRLLGMLVGRAKTDPLDAVLADLTGMREKADTSLLSLDGMVMSGSNPAARGLMIPGLKETLAESTTDGVTVFNYLNDSGALVTATFIRLPELQSILMVEQTRDEVARTSAATLAVNLSVTVSSLLVALFIALLSTRSIAGPLDDLVEISGRIAQSAHQAAQIYKLPGLAEAAPTGPLQPEAAELERRAEEWQNEIGSLALAFDQMTRQLSGLIAGLEQQISERTEALSEHARYLEASADVSRAASSVLEPKLLLPKAVELIRDRFDLYYVGLFLGDRTGEWAILRAGTGDAGQEMLDRGHRLRLEPTSMIGWCISNDQIRLAQVAGDDEVRIINPELPLTRSEAALPLHARGHVIGALSVQSSRANAFSPEGLQVLQTMADQLAVAIDNAQLFSRSLEAIEAERNAYTLGSKADWDLWRSKVVGKKQTGGLTGPSVGSVSIRSGATGDIETLDSWYPAMEQAYFQKQTVTQNEQLAIPIRVRGHVIGVLNATSASAPAGNLKSTGLGGWADDEVGFLERVAEQIGTALDAARLYAETRKRAEQERLVDELTGRMRATLDIQSVLETAAREMRDALGLSEIEVRLGEPPCASENAPVNRIKSNRNGAKQS